MQTESTVGAKRTQPQKGSIPAPIVMDLDAVSSAEDPSKGWQALQSQLGF